MFEWALASVGHKLSKICSLRRTNSFHGGMAIYCSKFTHWINLIIGLLKWLVKCQDVISRIVIIYPSPNENLVQFIMILESILLGVFNNYNIQTRITLTGNFNKNLLENRFFNTVEGVFKALESLPATRIVNFMGISEVHNTTGTDAGV